LQVLILCSPHCFGCFTIFLGIFCAPTQNKQIVSQQEMVDRIKAAVSGRTDPDFVIMARTDALASEGLEAAIARAKAYIEAGADMLFPEACTKLEDYRAFQTALSPPNFPRDVPILANITEFGKTELFTTEELGSVGVSMVLYPLSAFRAMVRTRAHAVRRDPRGIRFLVSSTCFRSVFSLCFHLLIPPLLWPCMLVYVVRQSKAALTVYETIVKEGTQKTVVPLMQTRAELYE